MKKKISVFLAALTAAVLVGSSAVNMQTQAADGKSRINNFACQAQEYLEYIGENFLNQNDETGGSTAMAEWIVKELEKAGYEQEQIIDDVINDDGMDVRNIVLTVEGSDTSKQIIAGAHYDGSGIGDNSSGTALLLSTAIGLKDQELPYTVKYIFFDKEEDGCVGSWLYADNMTEEEIASTVYMINIDAIAFGDYCNVYGGTEDESGNITMTEGYDLAMAKAEALGFKTMKTEDLDGYYDAHGAGPAVEADTVYSNPWTAENPAPGNADYISPSTGAWSDHVAFEYSGMTYIYFEAANWFTEGDGGWKAYTSYFETDRSDLGVYGMFMNTEYDTLENLDTYFPGRSLEHFNIFSPLLSSLIMNPDSAEPTL